MKKVTSYMKSISLKVASRLMLYLAKVIVGITILFLSLLIIFGTRKLAVKVLSHLYELTVDLLGEDGIFRKVERL